MPVKASEQQSPIWRGKLGHEFTQTVLVVKIWKGIHVRPHLARHLDIPRLVFGDEFLKLLDMFRGLRLNDLEHLVVTILERRLRRSVCAASEGPVLLEERIALWVPSRIARLCLQG